MSDNAHVGSSHTLSAEKTNTFHPTCGGNSIAAFFLPIEFFVYYGKQPKKKTMIRIIAATGNYVHGKGFPIGKDGIMPWHVPADLKWFKKTTENCAVVMGRRTYEALDRKPLPNRYNYIVSRTMDAIPNGFAGVIPNIEGIAALKALPFDTYIIGGGELYKACLEAGIVDEVLVDRMSIDVKDADTFMDPLDENEWECFPEGIMLEDLRCSTYRFVHRKVRNLADEQYQGLVRRILEEGSLKNTRAGMVKSVFGAQMRFNLSDGLPVLTTKKVYTNGIIHELLWFLKGDTNIKYLVDNNVHIWDDDAYRYYLELIGKNNATVQESSCLSHENWKMNITTKEPLAKDRFIEEVKKGTKMWVVTSPMVGFMSYYPNDYCFEYTYGDLGPVYGKQWRDWHGVDQIKNVIETLKTNPDDRRMVVSAWNASEIDNMALPPCHYSFQFWTEEMFIGERMEWAARHNLNCWDGESLDNEGVPSRKLSCMFNMRSNDVGCGTSFNMASYAILTHMIAQCVNMVPNDLIYSVGDAHVYTNNIPGLKEQLSRDPHKYALPTLELNPNVKDIDSFTFEDIHIQGYQSYPAIKLELNAGL